MVQVFIISSKCRLESAHALSSQSIRIPPPMEQIVRYLINYPDWQLVKSSYRVLYTRNMLYLSGRQNMINMMLFFDWTVLLIKQEIKTLHNFQFIVISALLFHINGLITRRQSSNKRIVAIEARIIDQLSIIN